MRIVDFAFFFSGLTGGVDALLSVEALFNEADTVVIMILCTDGVGDVRPFRFEDDADILSSKIDIDDAEGNSCLLRGDGESGAGTLSELDSSSPSG